MASFVTFNLRSPNLSSNKRPIYPPFFCKAVDRFNPPSGTLHRRNLLIGLGVALYSASLLSTNPRTDSPVHTHHLNVWPIVLEMNTAAATSADGEFPRALDTVVNATVKRPKRVRSREEKEQEEEVLVLDGIEVNCNMPVKFDILINAEDWATCGPGSSEFAGSFVHVPRKPWRPDEKVRTSLRLGITELLEDLKADRDDQVMVTLVPRAGKDVRVGGLRIEYSS